ncbi:hypothetical protein [Rhodovulum sulfidophilum]|uniref:hypothetical protein n=1 Tax=Rhodovulum sulfidophilum TaxID=35806 RepID=UPI000AC9072E|nr:hypothetical protein [Rhodovulum sulfidophilum]
MNDMTPTSSKEGANPRAVIGGNNPPDPLDEALAPYGDFITEAEGWLDGTQVTTAAQMKAVDDLAKEIKAAEKAVSTARDAATKPLHAAWQAEIARWKPTLEDLDRIKKGLAALVSTFKVRLKAEQDAAARKARAEADRKRREAEEAARTAAAGDIEAQRAAAQAQAEAKAARKAASAAGKDRVKGVRTVTRYEIESHKAALHDIAKNDRDALTDFVEAYVRRHHKDRVIAGVRVWEEKEAY